MHGQRIFKFKKFVYFDTETINKMNQSRINNALHTTRFIQIYHTVLGDKEQDSSHFSIWHGFAPGHRRFRVHDVKIMDPM